MTLNVLWPTLIFSERPSHIMVSATIRFACERVAMTETALTELQNQIETIRREAFAEGYAVAMQRLRN